jgi:hypothetical protein
MFSLFPSFTTFTVSVVYPYGCLIFNMGFEYPKLPLMCSMYLIRNIRPVCPVYFIGQSTQFFGYKQISRDLVLYLLVEFYYIFNVSYSECYFICASLKICDLCYFSAICKNSRFRFLMLQTCVFVFF